ncbi:MAG: hypothetical protein NVS3B20_16800 [Polyangiales bacterium]
MAAIGSDTIARIHADVDHRALHLHVLHAARLQCRRGCSACCVDGLTVFEAEAEHIRRHHADLLQSGAPHAEGACAFLDDEGACRIYAERPYVCRTQGLPLRWIDRREGGREGAPVEFRDICPLNEENEENEGLEPIESLPVDDCFTLGPIEERLARLQLAATSGGQRTRLRDLFVTAFNGHARGGSTSLSKP